MFDRGSLWWDCLLIELVCGEVCNSSNMVGSFCGGEIAFEGGQESVGGMLGARNIG